jgi:small subunit ribosomal protein S2
MSTSSSLPVSIPDVSEFLKAGVQFGHESKRWNPKMKEYIFSTKNNIHIIDVSRTMEDLEIALKALINFARQGSILFVGTKRQASAIVEKEAVRAGAYFVTNRWPGGLLTNFPVVMKSLKKLRDLEESFENGIKGVTKYEIVKMKSEWVRLDRLYRGIKTMSKFPTAIVIIDPKFEIGAVLESKKINAPTIALVDTNSDPTAIDYMIPGNDDALRSIELFMKLFADAVLLGNGGQGVKHNLKDYAKAEVQILKINEVEEIQEAQTNSQEAKSTPTKKIRIRTRSAEQETSSKKTNKPAAKKTAAKAKSPVKKTVKK